MIKTPVSNEAPSARLPSNAAIFIEIAEQADLAKTLSEFCNFSAALVISDDPMFAAGLDGQLKVGFSEVGLNESPIMFDGIRSRILQLTQSLPPDALVIVDMRWILVSVSAAANFERWGGQCDRMVEDISLSIVSVYDRRLLLEDQLLAAMHGHRHFLAPSGTYENPFWLPLEYQTGVALHQQVSFLMSRIVPDYADMLRRQTVDNPDASGADPKWLSGPKRVFPHPSGDQVWKIRCFGQLRIYLADGSQIKWNIPGSSPRKSKALFAYLMHCGERGAPAEKLAELLWPEEADEQKIRGRLHHTIAMLRRALGGNDYVVRTGDYYHLQPPVHTWIDTADFEQLCRRSRSLAAANQTDEVIAALDAAERLYSGDLLEDISVEFAETDVEDWLSSRRAWFREMIVKVHRDKAVVLRKTDRFREALESCHKALALNPASEIAHAEAMRIYHAQGRIEAMTRQYRQYLSSLQALGLALETTELEGLYRELVATEDTVPLRKEAL